MIQYIYRQSSWEVLKDFMWWYFVVKCNEFHHSLSLDIKKLVNIKDINKEYRRVANARYRAHRLDILYNNTITRR